MIDSILTANYNILKTINTCFRAGSVLDHALALYLLVNVHMFKEC